MEGDEINLDKALSTNNHLDLLRDRNVGSRLTGEHKPGQTAFSAALLSLALWPWSAALRNANYANLKKMKLLLCCCCCRRCYQICS